MRARVQIPLTPPKNTTTHPVVVFFNEEWDLKGRPSKAGQKVSGGHFLGRGKIHAWQDAAPWL